MILNYVFFFNLCGGTLDTAATTGLLYQPQMIGEGDCGEIGGMKIVKIVVLIVEIDDIHGFIIKGCTDISVPVLQQVFSLS
jgi:hypothetical protein